jgi:crotonobetainyl-CoA:carnitine CoA-transferase CaiB-like acyl-CoA transferase
VPVGFGALDLTSEADRAVFLDLVEDADGLVENMRAGVLDRLGVGYETLRQRNPRIVYGAIRGFGDPRTGRSPHADWPAFDIVAQSMGGLARINGPASPTGYPAGASVGDLYPGTLLALGVVAAVHEARRTGLGQFLDVGMYDAITFLCETVIANYGYDGTELQARGAGHPNLCPFDLYPAADGAIAIAAPGPKHWAALCLAMSREDLVDDPRTRNVRARVEHRELVNDAIIAWTAPRTREQINAEAGRRITAKFPVHEQINVVRGAKNRPGMWDWIDAVRAAAAALEAQSPIPDDFRADTHWPAQ